MLRTSYIARNLCYCAAKSEQGAEFGIQRNTRSYPHKVSEQWTRWLARLLRRDRPGIGSNSRPTPEVDYQLQVTVHS
jgi:hypothetical protein